ncbi:MULTISPECIES: DUF2933 domain-containing protein [unclassified Polaromonas]|jgi:hypothetical protein|uniref:DUF2933 domain-containing protein n=1 Tax=unclassified Polaromonas TaxID=2638319 RepID=UPI000BD5BD64|nr:MULTISPECIES: DUF2933 domain-containing protein [unclassified Polaromonas]OYY36663.1 MAG: hypothetical protein B7Y60_10855 [Polaromonas sp. 35-63-35]OYZ18699.1 MAG: hypothetical protein B7Y28_14945 [Polaromonas sp. 16-63-31]OYZ80892.1 MAG: hypothetical protein B7Y09_00160 [Polaromonas sp. 24-63-21]OZA52894.1 MAG: hypothetical protein B7X88_02995 [Polaromonas sp. 17-63-33]OZA88255.1 MAG: hypothetical protein B7X65_06630 [Polaromonas sp. 39-63-25]
MDPFDNDRQAPSFWRRPAGMAVATAALIAGFYLLREHWGHVLGYWPYLLLLACPLMHLMHGHGHGGHKHRRDEPERTNQGAG